MLLTVAICTWNRAGLLRETLESLQLLRIPDGVEIETIVCDNNSTDTTKDVLREFEAQYSCRSIFEPNQGKSHALARLIHEARGDWILFLDDDIRPDLDWVIGYCEAMARYREATFFAGQIYPRLEVPLTGLKGYIFRAFPGVSGVVTSETDYRITIETSTNVGGGNTAFRRDSVLIRSANQILRRFAEQNAICEDTVLLLDHLDQGCEGWFLTAPKVFHYVPQERAGLAWFWTWSYRRGKTYCRTPWEIAEGLTLTRYSLQVRWTAALQNLTGFRIGPLLLSLLSFVAIGVGFAVEATRRRKPVAGTCQ